MSVKKIDNGYVIDFTLDGVRFRERITAPHNKSAEKRIQEQEAVYRMAISLNDLNVAARFSNSSIIKKAFQSSCHYTIKDYAKIWFKQKRRNWSHTTYRGYSQKYTTHILPHWGSLILSDFKASMFDEWASESDLSGKSINEVRNVLNQIFKRAYYDQAIDNNPINLVERYKQDHIEPKPFNSFEIHKILQSLHPPHQQHFKFAFFTGLRTGEILGLRWQDVDIDKRVAHIRVSITDGKEKEPKTKGSIRTIELNQDAVQALIEIKQGQFYNEFRVFIDPKTGKNYKYSDGLRKYVWKPALKEAKVLYRYPYQTRHTYASMMLSKGHNPMWVAKQMGHADWGMIRKTYGRWIAEPTQELVP